MIGGTKMNIIDLSKGKRETYQTEIKSSLLLESALGIAAITNERLKHTLDQDSPLTKKAFNLSCKELKKDLDFVFKNNTWKALLQLLHYSEAQDLSSFESFIDNLNDENLKFYSIPYLGMEMQQVRLDVAKGSEEALIKATEFVKSNEFFPSYINFIANVDPSVLRNHLKSVMSKWFKEVILEEEKTYMELLQRDGDMKKSMMDKLEPEEFVKWATGGIEYAPEPSVTKVLLIPHYIYRPWNINADFENTKVFYYPVSNESIYPNNRLTPDNFLILKFKALGDETRLKIMKILFENEQTLQELSVQLDMPKSSLHHHLSILKSARLITTHNGVYEISRWAIDTLSNEFFNFLKK